MLHFAGIKRNTEFSPNHRGNDNAIFTLTAAELIKKGCTVTLYSEDEFMEMDDVFEDCIFTMARNKQTVKKLQKAGQQGKWVINSGAGIENCYRINMTNGLVNAGIPYPKSIIVNTQNITAKEFTALKGNSYWIKRGDFHAIHKEDVSFARNIGHALDILKEYHLRGITEAVISEHLHGDLVKFYGVRGTGFFYWFYPVEFNHSKFNAEAINGASNYYAFSEEKLKDFSTKAAEALDIYIYGGDAIIAQDGSMHFIDLNDWPSFAPCREEASLHIAQCIYQQAKKSIQQVK
ncbi:MAG: hypothetical protein IPO46_08750 [Chitinophagaceae bacterium]|jgi:glutathione synthase/RimK-type ligase-like ATP-grasp enzyme|nr:hypothetical protein [Chitinophagaceae bacterium]MBP6047453.1 hypothetical protein [Ferruginibacter sp.]MBK7089331.1 hypothetical protein [Chitinophagaceae bacterium]MBK7345618.1 hypothetical protein [Chitinophagaceae bacterium]MBK8930019.1 hypothetical protein [Chitinophagaceae bacterium]